MVKIHKAILYANPPYLFCISGLPYFSKTKTFALIGQTEYMISRDVNQTEDGVGGGGREGEGGREHSDNNAPSDKSG